MHSKRVILNTEPTLYRPATSILPPVRLKLTDFDENRYGCHCLKDCLGFVRLNFNTNILALGNSEVVRGTKYRR